MFLTTTEFRVKFLLLQIYCFLLNLLIAKSEINKKIYTQAAVVDFVPRHGLVVFCLTLCLLLLSADNLCKQFGPRSGPTKCHT